MSINAKDIAKELGISAATVSLVLRNKPGISDATRKKVLEAANKLGYKKMNLVDSLLSKYVQIVIYVKHGSVVSDTPFFTQLIQGVDQEIKSRGYKLLITYFYESQNISEQLHRIASSNCSGLIILATEMTRLNMAPFEQLNLPIVSLDNYFPDLELDCITINNNYGVKNAVTYFVSHGHTEIGYLHSKVDIRNFYERMDGYYKGVRTISTQNGSKSRIVKIAPTAEEAIIDMDRYLSTTPTLPTAFFADNDIIASSCIKSLQKAGYKIPNDVSIIGFDDMPICELLNPPMTTVNVPKMQLGKLAADRLISRIEGNDEASVRIEVSTRLIERASVQFLR